MSATDNERSCRNFGPTPGAGFHGGIERSSATVARSSARLRACSYVSSGNGPTCPLRWHSWQFFWRIRAISWEYVGTAAGRDGSGSGQPIARTCGVATAGLPKRRRACCSVRGSPGSRSVCRDRRTGRRSGRDNGAPRRVNDERLGRDRREASPRAIPDDRAPPGNSGRNP